MAGRGLHLFPDTNLFMQCRPLEELGWTNWNDYEEVLLIICRAVQAEIDQHKNKGNDRLARRARSASGMFRDVILCTELFRTIREDGPVVHLQIRPELRPSKDLENRLDYSNSDDLLVGTVAAYIHDHPNVDVRLLTHDTGPMATAKMVGVPVTPIPDSWLLPPEQNPAERRIAKLEAELLRLQRNEPHFEITCVDDKNNRIERIDAVQLQFEPLTQDELSTLLSRLQTQFPIATDFVTNDVPESLLLADALAFREPTTTEISAYRDSYTHWIAACHQVLRTCHQTITEAAPPPMFRFSASNVGNRPGTDVLWIVKASGPIMILPPYTRKRTQVLAALKLPSPPTAPTRVLRRSPLEEMMQYRIPEAPSLLRDFGFPSTAGNVSRDRNARYWKPNRPTEPGQSLVLECEQWRHGDDAALFRGVLRSPDDSDDVGGLLECTVQAANLSTAAILQVPVRLVTRRMSAYGAAKRLVDKLIERRKSPLDSIRDSIEP